MFKALHTSIILAMILLSGEAFSQAVPGKKPVKIIYDTDIDLDVDDVGALALLHALADNGEAEILGVICDSPTPYGATTISSINRYYKHPEIPIGDMPVEEYIYDKSFTEKYHGYAVNFPYGHFNVPMFGRFDHGIKSRKDVWNGMQLYRKLLSEAPDKSVTIAAVGLVTILEDLMYSKPDKYSKLTGMELIKKKVDQLVCMVGASEPRREKIDFNWGFDGRGDAERVSRQWPTPIVIMPLGSAIKTGARLTTETPETNPVRAAYELFLAKEKTKSRSSWDQLTVLYAVRGAGDLFTEVSGKRLEFTETPVLYEWREVQQGEISHVLLKQVASNEILQKIVEDLMVQAPK
ncbi:MAG TPA: hypothetical protein VNI52_06545 [Sphingobacteriaceae bacterium]|nr:hypothetical protein [Sphingobacteriaceae bacterium]